MNKKVLFVFGTRPEAIKMAPIIKAFGEHSEYFKIKICTTGQHREMLQQVMDFFNLKADYELSLMQHNQTLFDITANVLKSLEGVLQQYEPDYLFVQGDTTTAMAGAMAGFYKKVSICHVEAGLRSGDIYSPFPEEVNRRVVSAMCSYHFAPTLMAKENLEKENHHQNIFVTGNTVIDALLWGVEKVRESEAIKNKFPYLGNEKKFLLITAHRRESFGKPFMDICEALLQLAKANPSFDLVYPVHLNPNVQEVVYEKLSDQQNIHLIEPVDYPTLLWLLDRCYFVLTDSGGIQEEAPALGKPVLVLRNVTERQEGIDAGTAILVGTDKDIIVTTAQELIDNTTSYEKMAKAVNPYGNGTAAKQITSVILNSIS